jgi:RsmE family RNA methyltransferase
MNLLLLEEHDFTTNDRAEVRGARLEHIRTILGAKVGDTLTAGQLHGKIGTATITSLTDSCATLQTRLTREPPPPLPLTMVLALPRPKALRRILRNVAELGIKELYLVNAYKVEKSYWDSPLLHEEAIHTFLTEGLSQAKDTVLPQVFLKKRFRPFVEDELPALALGKEAFIAHPYQASPAPAASPHPRLVAIGPEGGFIPFEVELLQQQGLQAIQIGERIYRVENALTLLTSRLSCTFPVDCHLPE